MTEYVCADCGSELEKDGFIQAACSACGGLDAITLAEYQTNHGTAQAAFWRKNDTTYFALSDASISNEAWVACESPGEVTR